MKIEMIDCPNQETWNGVKERALVTINKKLVKPPTEEWLVKIIRANHSVIRYARFSFYLEGIPSFVSVHLCRHIHAQPYVMSQRNDRQNNYDRNKAPQDSPVNMIWDLNLEELITVAHKRLCYQASEETRQIVKEICNVVVQKFPFLKEFLVPQCIFLNKKCNEMFPCGKYEWSK